MVKRNRDGRRSAGTEKNTEDLSASQIMECIRRAAPKSIKGKGSKKKRSAKKSATTVRKDAGKLNKLKNDDAETRE